MKGYCLGCGGFLKSMTNGSSYCGQCSRRLKSIHTQVRCIVDQAKLEPAEGKTCVDCGQRAVLYDHRYYSRPLDVVPVCKSCNNKRGPARDVADVLRNGLLYIPKFTQEPAATVTVERLKAAMNEFERQAIIKALESTRWNKTEAAKSLGITFRAMRYRLERLKIA